jgi:hypothetical protein
VSDFIFRVPGSSGPCPSDYRFLHSVYYSFRKKVDPGHP